MYAEFLAASTGDGGFGDYEDFGETEAYSDLMAALAHGKTRQGTIQKGSLNWQPSNGDGLYIRLPEVVLFGTSSLVFGLQLSKYVNAYMKEWNAQYTADFLANRIADQVLPPKKLH